MSLVSLPVPALIALAVGLAAALLAVVLRPRRRWPVVVVATLATGILLCSATPIPRVLWDVAFYLIRRVRVLGGRLPARTGSPGQRPRRSDPPRRRLVLDRGALTARRRVDPSAGPQRFGSGTRMTSPTWSRLGALISGFAFLRTARVRPNRSATFVSESPGRIRYR